MLNRRELITALLGCEVAAFVGCSTRSLPPEGRLLGTDFQMGHQIRDGQRTRPDSDAAGEVGVVIVGGGIAGLSAAWRLSQAGFDDFVLLELESVPGGTARGGRRGDFAYPWGAHYVPVPMPENRPFLHLLTEIGVVDRFDDQGRPVIKEQFLCRDPSERLFHDGSWQEGIYPYSGASDDDLRQLDEFRAEVDHWVARRDDKGRRMFAIPMATGSDDAQVRALDTMSMADWMDERNWTSPRLRWYVDYACRDDYGLGIDEVSGWAGVFYFASRVPRSGDDPQSVITWPEGNARIVEHLVGCVESHLRCGMAVSEVTRVGEPADELSVVAIETGPGNAIGFRADQVIFAAPQFMVPHVIRDLQPNSGGGAGSASISNVDRSRFQYGSWLVANVHLRDRPREMGFPMCWDNVIYGSKSLGYVTATHQLGLDHGPTVLTWYHPLAGVDPRLSRQKMLRLGWADWADLVITDLRTAHADIDSLVTRVDIMRWGHAMIQPRVGFVWSENRIAASKPQGGIHFAGTDLSGVPLIEEAFYHGIRAAEEVLTARGWPFESLA